MMPKRIAVALVLTAAVQAAPADEPALEPVLVSATRNPTPIENAPGQVEVVTAADLEKRGVHRISDAINELPGVFVQTGRGMMQHVQSIALRGIPDEKRTLMLLDGMPLNDGYAGGVRYGGLSVDSLERIEVLYGPMSSLYGGNAMGGVVAYTTRMPRAAEFRLRTGFGDPFQSGKGPENVRRTSLSAGNRFANDLAVLFSSAWASTDGYRSEWVTSDKTPSAGIAGWKAVKLPNGAPGYLLGDKGRTEWAERSHSLKLEQRLGNGDRWRFGWLQQAYRYGQENPRTYLRTAGGAPTYDTAVNVTEAIFINGDAEYRRNQLNFGYETELADGLFNVNVGYSHVAVNSYITPTGNVVGGGGRIANSPTHGYFLDAYWNRQFGAHALTTGVAWRRDDARNKEYSLANWRNEDARTALYTDTEGDATSIGLYVQDDWRLRHDLAIHLGLRHDRWKSSDGAIRTPGYPVADRVFRDYPSRSESAWSPKAALVWQVRPDLAWRTSLGSAFRAPTVYELYRTARIGTKIFRANPDLDPETVRTWDLGADWQPWRGGEVKATLFANRMRDLIYTRTVDNKYRDRVNVERAESHGITLGLTQKVGTASRLFANATLTESEVTKHSRAPGIEGKRLTSLPKVQATLGGETTSGAWTLSASGRYASKQYSDDDNSDKADHAYAGYDAYFVADAKVSYRFDRQVAVSLAIDNLFDREYFSYYPAPRRTWFAELQFDY